MYKNWTVTSQNRISEYYVGAGVRDNAISYDIFTDLASLYIGRDVPLPGWWFRYIKLC